MLNSGNFYLEQQGSVVKPRKKKEHLPIAGVKPRYSDKISLLMGSDLDVTWRMFVRDLKYVCE